MAILINKKRFLLILVMGLFFCLSQSAYGQKKKQEFDYGRKNKNHGTVFIECFLESEDGKFKKPLQELEAGEVKLGDFKGGLLFRVSFSNLVLGLKSNYTDVKKSSHNLAYSLEVSNESVIQSPAGVKSFNQGEKRINPSNNDYQTGLDLLYKIDGKILEEVSGSLKFKYAIVGKSGVVSGESWDAGSVSFSYAIIPSNSFLKAKDITEKEELAYMELKNASSKPNVFRKLCEHYILTYPGVNPERMEEIVSIVEKLNATNVEKETESKYWIERVLPAVESGDKNEIIKWCKEYRSRYKYDKNYTACLLILIRNLPEGQEKNEVIKSWENLTSKSYGEKSKGTNSDNNSRGGNSNRTRSDKYEKNTKRDLVAEVDSVRQGLLLKKDPSIYIADLPVGYENPTAEMRLVSDGVVIHNARGGVQPYILKISSSENGGFEFVDDFEGENFKVSFNDGLKAYSGNKWLKLEDEHNTEMARLDNVLIKQSTDLTWVYIGLLGVICFIGYQIYKKYFLV